MIISQYPQKLSEVLTALIQEHKINESELARRINLPRATINRITSGKIIDPKSSTLTLIANYFNISIDQLLGYEKINFSHTLRLTNRIQVPLLELNQLIDIYKRTKQLNFDLLLYKETITFEYDADHKKLFALKIYGDAMWPYFDNNSTIIIDPTIQPQNRSFVITYIAKTDEIILRQLLIDVKSRVLTPINPAFKSLVLEIKDIIIGVVIHVEKTFSY